MRYFTLLIITSILGLLAASGQPDPPGQLSFDTLMPGESARIANITVTGNKKTRERIIFRELEFNQGDTLAADRFYELLKSGRENLLNTSLFNIVKITPRFRNNGSKEADILIHVTERWYIWPFPIFELGDRNFNTWWKKKDFTRVNYGLYMTLDNFSGNMDRFTLLTRFGYDEKYNASYELPYINKKQTFGISVGGGYTRNHEVRITTLDNQLEYYKDTDSYPIEKYYGYLAGRYRDDIHNSHLLQATYNDFQFQDTILALNPRYSYGSKKRNQFISLHYKYKHDYRDIKNYPLQGHYFDLEIYRAGLGLTKNQKADMTYIKTALRRFVKLGKRLYYAAGFSGKFSLKENQPYFYQAGLGYGRDFVRGYEYYVIDGQHFAMIKTNFKFAVIPERIIKLPLIPWEKFNTLNLALYASLIADAGYVWDDIFYRENPMANSLLTGYGFGLDLVTYYDMVFRAEYSFNHLGESGLFLHFMAGI